MAEIGTCPERCLWCFLYVPSAVLMSGCPCPCPEWTVHTAHSAPSDVMSGCPEWPFYITPAPSDGARSFIPRGWPYQNASFWLLFIGPTILALFPNFIRFGPIWSELWCFKVWMRVCKNFACFCYQLVMLRSRAIHRPSSTVHRVDRFEMK